MVSLSIVIPTLNEETNNFLFTSLEKLTEISDIEIVIVDGGSTDDTIKRVKQYNCRIIESTENSRAERLNIGVQSSKGELILLNHPRSVVDTAGIELLKTLELDKVSWGGFTHKFDISHPILKFTSWYSNNIRAFLSKILYLDHCIYFKRKDFINLGPIPKVDIFEDTFLSKFLSEELGRPKILPYNSITSAIRFTQRGIIKHSIVNQILKVLFYLRIDHKKMNLFYEKKAQLNSKYED